jgi:hypothetical protein
MVCPALGHEDVLGCPATAPPPPHSWHQHWMEVSGLLHAPTAFLVGKESRYT